MSTWVIISWVFVGILTGINIFVFIKLKQASEQMMKMAFPGAKDMNEAVSQMQKMMGSMGGSSGLAAMAKQMGQGGRGGNMDAQIKAAMEMLQKSQKR